MSGTKSLTDSTAAFTLQSFTPNFRHAGQFLRHGTHTFCRVNVNGTGPRAQISVMELARVRKI